MKVFLLSRDHDFDLQRELPINEPALTQDLGLNNLFNAMAVGDRFLFEVVKKTVLFSLHDIETILYRQDILKDCLKNSAIVRNIYDIAVDSIESKKKHYYWFSGRYPSSTLHSSVEMLQTFVDYLINLKNIADEHADKFESAGFTKFFVMIQQELNDEYFIDVPSIQKKINK